MRGMDREEIERQSDPEERAAEFRNSWEEVYRVAAELSGHPVASDAEVVWKDPQVRWRDIRMPGDDVHAELMVKYEAVRAASRRHPVAILAPEDWWPDVARALGLPIVRRELITEVTITVEEVPELTTEQAP